MLIPTAMALNSCCFYGIHSYCSHCPLAGLGHLGGPELGNSSFVAILSFCQDSMVAGMGSEAGLLALLLTSCATPGRVLLFLSQRALSVNGGHSGMPPSQGCREDGEGYYTLSRLGTTDDAARAPCGAPPFSFLLLCLLLGNFECCFLFAEGIALRSRKYRLNDTTTLLHTLMGRPAGDRTDIGILSVFVKAFGIGSFPRTQKKPFSD